MSDDRIKRVRWRCRRGMRELDVLLTEFVEAHYPTFSEAKRQTFDALLEASDMELHAWLTGREQPVSNEMLELVDAIRGHNKVSPT